MAKKEEEVKEEPAKSEKSDKEVRWEVFCAAALKQAEANDKLPHDGVSYVAKVKEKLAKGMPETFR